MKKLGFALLLFSVCTMSCAVTYPIVKPTYDENNAAEIVVIRLDKYTYGNIALYIKIDDNAVCVLPERGNYTKFHIASGQHKFEAVMGHETVRSQPKTFDIEANKTYYFRPNNSYGGVMHIFRISEIEASNLMGLEKYKYVSTE